MLVTGNLSAPGDRLGVTPDLAAFMVFRGLLPVSSGQSQQPITWEKGVNSCLPRAGTAEMLHSGKGPGCRRSTPSSHPAGLAPWSSLVLLSLGMDHSKGRAGMQIVAALQP